MRWLDLVLLPPLHHSGLSQGNYGAADDLYLRCINILEITLGPDDLELAGSLSNRAGLLQKQVPCHYLRNFAVGGRYSHLLSIRCMVTSEDRMLVAGTSIMFNALLWRGARCGCTYRLTLWNVSRSWCLTASSPYIAGHGTLLLAGQAR